MLTRLYFSFPRILYHFFLNCCAYFVDIKVREHGILFTRVKGGGLDEDEG